ncbi:hypothetical protein [Neolewinella litorea]|uniref:Uncharacterized protein n=1 Tax=Neolewinella litorea TaxID=2562452 RepID=A0A4S4NNW8_9BACT|nr:hypothetical protein [Neolewinella litorea]THH41572.1 hypothetical protein E4021_02975 [Neolewinella litorea]
MALHVSTPISDLRHIRQLMERSRYFIGLSGLSGVGAGCCALVGVALVAAYRVVAGHPPLYLAAAESGAGLHPWGVEPLPFLLAVAAMVVAAAVSTAVYFTHRRVARLGYTIADRRTYKLLLNLAVPLAAGGAFCLGLIYHGEAELVAPATLVFYGLALLNGSNFTTEDLRVLAYLEIGIGLLALAFPAYGLYCWALGFGLLHIAYGYWLYLKYDAHE